MRVRAEQNQMRQKICMYTCKKITTNKAGDLWL